MLWRSSHKVATWNWLHHAWSRHFRRISVFADNASRSDAYDRAISGCSRFVFLSLCCYIVLLSVTLGKKPESLNAICDDDCMVWCDNPIERKSRGSRQTRSMINPSAWVLLPLFSPLSVICLVGRPTNELIGDEADAVDLITVRQPNTSLTPSHHCQTSRQRSA